ncbi:MAG: hypothetical protein ACJ75H_01140 [Thermoanaerobaculia bacterium]
MHCRLLLLCALLPALAGAPGCGGPKPDEAGTARPQPATDAEWSWLQGTRKELDVRRARAAANPADARLAREAEARGAEFNRRLVELLNADPPVQGEPLSERQKAALRMKTDEDIHLARTFIDKGGDYQRAIDIYREALAVDPGNSRLREELARAEARRYVTREAFAQVQGGMDQEAVRKLLGQPNLNNVRAYGERGVVGWFYPKDASGAAAAVWFHKEAGRFTVYLADFDAIQPQAPPAEPPPAPAPPRET